MEHTIVTRNRALSLLRTGLSQAKVAGLVGVHQHTVWRWARGTETPTRPAKRWDESKRAGILEARARGDSLESIIREFRVSWTTVRRVCGVL
jgi:transposase